MPLALLLTSDVVDMHLDAENAWLYLDWKGPQDLPLVQAACRHLTDLLRGGVHKVLNDNTHITHTSWELVKWVAYNYLPEAGAAGLHYVAWVQSPLPSCRGYVDLMDDFSSEKPQVALFDELAGACAWLGSVGTAAAPKPLLANN